MTNFQLLFLISGLIHTFFYFNECIEYICDRIDKKKPLKITMIIFGLISVISWILFLYK